MANAAIINLKRWQMTFEGNGLRVIIPLDPSQGERYTEPLRDEGEQDTLDHIYNITATDADYVEPNTDGVMDWQCDSSCMSDSDDGLENWQQRLYELHGHRCAQITQSLRCLRAQPRELPAQVGMTDLGKTILRMPDQVPQSQRMQTLETALGATAAGWIDHKNSTPSWGAYQKFLCLKFINQFQEVQSKFNGQNSPQEHLRQSFAAWDNNLLRSGCISSCTPWNL